MDVSLSGAVNVVHGVHTCVQDKMPMQLLILVQLERTMQTHLMLMPYRSLPSPSLVIILLRRFRLLLLAFEQQVSYEMDVGGEPTTPLQTSSSIL